MSKTRFKLFAPCECPNCRQPVTRFRVFFSTAWSRWRCRNCGALMGVDTKRRFFAMIPWTAVVLLFVLYMRMMQYGPVVTIATLAICAVLLFMSLDRLILYESAGFRCTRCGYDLQGQEQSPCPECGCAFDLAKLEDFRSGRSPAPVRVNLWWRRILIFAMLASLTIIVAFGLFRTVRMRARPPLPGTAPAATPGANAPAESAPGPDETTSEDIEPDG